MLILFSFVLKFCPEILCLFVCCLKSRQFFGLLVLLGRFRFNLGSIFFCLLIRLRCFRLLFPIHSTGANNPWLKRYVGPDDGLLGKNQYNNHWNQPMDREVCVHAFIGKLADGTVATYQTLPWDYRGWHCAGSGNDNWIYPLFRGNM